MRSQGIVAYRILCFAMLLLQGKTTAVASNFQGNPPIHRTRSRVRYLGLLLAVLLLATLQGTVVEAQGSQQTHIVRRGDTLYSIAQQYNTTVDQIRELNDLAGTDILYVGQTLVLPSASPAAAVTPSTPSASSTPTVSSTSCTVSHTVRRGESLSAIARHFGVPVAQLAQANGISNFNLIRVGQLLCIPSATESATEPPPSVPTPSASPTVSLPRPSVTSYTVQGGDTLFAIARAHGVSIRDLMATNGIADPTRLYPGQTLRIPGTGAVAVATPAPVPAATVPTTGSFTVRYFNNLAFTGTPALVQTEAPGTRHDWGRGAPGPGVRPDNFSALLDGRFEFEEGLHRFTVTVDDGMRLYVDDNLVREAWHDQAVTTYVVDVHLTAGTHQVRLEYYERAADATLWLRWLPLFPTTMPVPPTAPPSPAPGLGYYTDNAKRAMFNAIGQNDIGTVRQLIASAGFPHFHFDQNRTALHYAAFADALEIMALLLSYPEADPNVLYNHPGSSTWNRNRTPLHEASANGHAGMAEMLLSHGADHWLVTGGGFTALHFAARNNHRQTVETLLRHGAAPNLRDDDNGYTPLHQVVTRRSESETLAALLRDRRIRPNLRDYRGRTPLHIAASRGNTAQVAALLNHPDTNPNELDDRETTALYQAVAEGHEEVVEELLDHPDTNPNIEDRRGWTPLFRAVYEGNEELVRQLLRHDDTDTEINTEEGWSGLWYAETHGYHDIARLLRRHGATGALG